MAYSYIHPYAAQIKGYHNDNMHWHIFPGHTAGRPCIATSIFLQLRLILQFLKVTFNTENIYCQVYEDIKTKIM